MLSINLVSNRFSERPLSRPRWPAKSTNRVARAVLLPYNLHGNRGAGLTDMTFASKLANLRCTIVEHPNEGIGTCAETRAVQAVSSRLWIATLGQCWRGRSVAHNVRSQATALKTIVVSGAYRPGGNCQQHLFFRSAMFGSHLISCWVSSTTISLHFPTTLSQEH